MKIPLIDFSNYQDEASVLKDLGQQMHVALTHGGFMAIRGCGLSKAMIDSVFTHSQEFFARPLEQKRQFGYSNATENFGYQGVSEEHLKPGTPADLKETFTMRNPLRINDEQARWPSHEFRQQMLDFYQACLQCAFRIQKAFTTQFELNADFFERCHNGQNISLRLLHYPSSGLQASSPEQMGAGEHTDYGTITLLFQDDVGGLEVQDQNGVWQPVEYQEDCIVINTGDLMHRWTNGLYPSTLHRVQPKLGHKDRYSVVLFLDPDSETRVEPFPTTVSEDRPAQFAPVLAGEYIIGRLEASHGSY